MTQVFVCKWRDHQTHCWVVEQKGACCFYEIQVDAWERCKTLARKSRGVATLYNKNGDVSVTVSYEFKARKGDGYQTDKGRATGPAD